jgi:enterochelin esterase family protein
VPYVDAKHRTLRRARHRAVAGKSSGGYGAIVHAMKHPEVFGAVACHSGDMAFEYCYMPDFPKILRAVWKKGSVTAWWREFERAPKKTWDLLAVLDMFAMAAAYSPNPKARPFRLDFPFDLETGEMRDDVWRRWLRLDPVRMIGKPAYRRALRKMSLVYLDCGNKDEFQLDLGARIFASKLREHGIRHAHEEFDDGHMDVSYRYDRSFPLLAKAISRR